MICEFEHKIFDLPAGGAGFEELALQVFHFQYQHNELYRRYVDTLHTDISSVTLVEQIPFLPISFFKTHAVRSGFTTEALLFESSGTTGQVPSRHYVKDAAIYLQSFRKGFEREYGPADQWCIVGLLPSYLERQHSSLVYMVDQLVRDSGHPLSGFYLYDHEQLAERLQQLEASGQRTLLIGVTFGLLDFAEAFPMPLSNTILMETGGMKGRKEEMTRAQVHAVLSDAFPGAPIHSEYGMTELLSQAYAKEEGIFECPPWMKVIVREEDDPFAVHQNKNTRGVINVIDLANLYSCSFIATEDAGRLYADGRFEVLGRVDHSEVRGCSLMAV
jgi:Acyl-protein synthetase, LuxE